MRHATRDQRYVRCPKASTLAYGRWRAQVGSWVVWRYPDKDGSALNSSYECGRMISRIVYSAGFPAGSNHDGAPDIHNWIEVLALSHSMHHASVRWIDPSWVTEVHPTAPDLARFLEWFASVDCRDHERLRMLAEYGALRPNQAPDMPDWNFERSLVRGDEYVDRVRKHRAEERSARNAR